MCDFAFYGKARKKDKKKRKEEIHERENLGNRRENGRDRK